MAGLFGVVVFPKHLHCPELQAGVAAKLPGSHAGADVLFSLGRYVRFNLFSEPFVAAAPGREV
jgi:hypothetical protein